MKTALILEGGGMRGVYTAGVLDFFLENNIDFDFVYGVSAGSCHGASYLSKQKGRALAISTDYLDDKRYCSIQSLIKTGDLFGAEFAYHTIPEKLNPYDFSAFTQNPTKFYVTVTNCQTGEAEYHLVHDMLAEIDVIRASASLPLVSQMVDIDGKPFLDGGIADSIPLKRSISTGLGKNVVILTQPREYTKKKNSAMALMKLKYKKYPKLIKAIENRHNVYNDTLQYIKQCEKDGSAFVIAPSVPLGIKRIDKDRQRLNNAYERGKSDAKASFKALKDYLQEY